MDPKAFSNLEHTVVDPALDGAMQIIEQIEHLKSSGKALTEHDVSAILSKVHHAASVVLEIVDRELHPLHGETDEQMPAAPIVYETCDEYKPIRSEDDLRQIITPEKNKEIDEIKFVMATEFSTPELELLPEDFKAHLTTYLSPDGHWDTNAIAIALYGKGILPTALGLKDNTWDTLLQAPDTFFRITALGKEFDTRKAATADRIQHFLKTSDKNSPNAYWLTGVTLPRSDVAPALVRSQHRKGYEEVLVPKTEKLLAVFNPIVVLPSAHFDIPSIQNDPIDDGVSFSELRTVTPIDIQRAKFISYILNS